jgi:hypothetical protein
MANLIRIIINHWQTNEQVIPDMFPFAQTGRHPQTIVKSGITLLSNKSHFGYQSFRLLRQKMSRIGLGI